MFKTLLIERKGAIRSITLNRPQVKNAMNAEMIDELFQAFTSIESSDRVVLLKGAGEFFCAGGDLQWMKSSVQKTAEENEKDALGLARMIRTIDECPVPIITQVRGGAFGGGVGLVAASDVVIAEETAAFSLSEVKLGLIPAIIGPLVMRKIGVSEARRLYLTGKRFSAQVAREIHLVHEVVPVGSLASVTQDYIREFSSSGPQAVHLAKQLIREIIGERLWTNDISEKTSILLSEVRVGKEAQAGMEAFRQKRGAPWNGTLC